MRELLDLISVGHLTIARLSQEMLPTPEALQRSNKEMVF